MSNILTVTLNPALDLSTSAPHVVPEDKLRCAEVSRDAGGGGVNVARAIGILGGRAKAFVALAGHVGAAYRDILAGETLDPVIFDIPGDTRQSFSVIDEGTQAQYRFVMPGPRWTPELAQAAIEAIASATPAGGYVVLSGSQPPGVPVHFPTNLAPEIEERGARLILDTSGPPLHALMGVGSARNHVLRLDGGESAELAGRKLANPGEVADFAASLIDRGVAEMVVLALGPDGSVLATRAGRWHARTRDVPVRSRIGAGDSFIGAFTLALAGCALPHEALVQGCAAASAAVMSDATDLCTRADTRALAQSAELVEI